MKKKLTGVSMIRNGLEYDYCFRECIASLQEFCDEVIVCDGGSTDGTRDILKGLENSRTQIIYCDPEEWLVKKELKHEILSYFSNKAIEQVGTEWFFYQQADEILTERSYDAVKEAMNLADYIALDGFMVSRINLWGSAATMLNVQGNRNPCSTAIVRLAKSHCRAIGDAESVDCTVANVSFFSRIRLYHFGFIRRKDRHVSKIREMEGNIFQVPIDPKLEGMNDFDPTAWFGPEDLEPVPEPLPRIMQQWILDRA